MRRTGAFPVLLPATPATALAGKGALLAVGSLWVRCFWVCWRRASSRPRMRSRRRSASRKAGRHGSRGCLSAAGSDGAAGHDEKRRESDIHLEADIRAQSDNANGFADGAWIPYLGIGYEITKAGASQKITGTLMPMVASDGPHYGDNVKLAGPGKYTLKLSIAPPGASAHAHFGRHTDKETGVGRGSSRSLSNMTSLCRHRQERRLLK
jgi:hypothetical protein